MKRKLTKLTTLLLAGLMAIGMVATVWAEPLPPATGTLTIHKYLMDRVANAERPNNGHEAGTNGNPEVPSSAKPLNGITFKVYKIEIPTTGANAGKIPVDGDYVLDNMENTTTLTSGSIVFNVTLADTLVTDGGTSDAPLGLATSINLAKGYYLVVEQANTAVAAPAAPFVVAIPMTNPTGDGWIADVHVYPKNEDLTVDKEPDVTSVEVGDTVTWTITGSIPADIADAKKYDIVDKLDLALNYTADSVVVKGLLNSGDTTGVTLTKEVHWNPIFDAGTNTLRVSFTEEGLKELAKYKFVSVSFDTVVNEGILGRLDYTIPNKATVEFINRNDDEIERETPETKVHTGAIRVDKTDANTGKMLEGAQFQIASSEANATAGRYLRKTSGGIIVDFGDPGYDTASPWIETTTQDGVDTTKAYALFKGLADYVEDTSGNKTYNSYWLVETKAPNGYNLLSNPIKVDFTADNSTEDTSYTVTIAVNNTTDFTLPQTGGIGMILFVVGGIVAVGIAVILIITGRKRDARNLS